MKGDRNKEIQILPFLSLLWYLPHRKIKYRLVMDQHSARGGCGRRSKKVLEEVVYAFWSSPFFSPGEIISRWNKWKNYIRPCSLMNCLHYLIFWVKSLRETGYHLLLGINPGINSTEGGSGVYSCRYGEGVPPPPPSPPPPPQSPLRYIWYTFPALVTLFSYTPPPIAQKNRGTE